MGYDLFRNTVGSEYFEEGHANIHRDIENISSTIQTNFREAKSYTDQKTEASEVYNKRHSGSWLLFTNPPVTPASTATLETILQIILSWTKLLQNSNKIFVGSGFSSLGKSGNVNYTDTVQSAIEKLVYKVTNQSNVSGIELPSNFNIQGREGEFLKNENLNILLEKIIYQVLKHNLSDNIHLPDDIDWGDYDGVDRIKGGSSLTDAIGNLVVQVANLVLQVANSSKLPNDFNPNNYSGIPAANETLTMAIGKLALKAAGITADIWNANFRDDDWYALVSVGDKIG